MAQLIGPFLFGVLCGSVPAAWVLVRLTVGKDVSRTGSGNVGALNASRVARSRWVGVVVVLLDGCKGAAAAWGVTQVGWFDGDATWLRCAASVGAMAGHNYNLWLSLVARSLVGGKGFAAVGGALLVFRPWLVPVWLVGCVVAWLLLRRTHGVTDEAPASGLATLLLIPAGWLLYDAPTVWMAVGFALCVAPKLVPECREVLRAASARGR